MIKVYKASGGNLDKLLAEIPENVEKNVINITTEEIPTTYREYEDLDEYGDDFEDDELELCEITDTYYKIKVFYHE